MSFIFPSSSQECVTGNQGAAADLGLQLENEHPVARPDSFPLFASLPKELRINVWKFALRPRVIPLHRNNDRIKGRGVYFPMAMTTMGFMSLTTHHPSLDTIWAACAESKYLCQKLYMDSEFWDVRRNCLGTLYSPEIDILFFSGQISTAVLMGFAYQYPVETSNMKSLALPGVFAPDTTSRTEVLAALHSFASLRNLIIVLGNRSAKAYQVKSSWEGDAVRSQDVWALPEGIEDALQKLQRNKWPTWKVPSVRIVRSFEDILR